MSTIRNSKPKTFGKHDFDCLVVLGGTNTTGYRLSQEGLNVVAEGALSVEEAKMDKHELKNYHTENGPSAGYRVAKGEYGRMVALDGDKTTVVNLNIPESKVKSVPENHYMIDTAIAVGTCIGIE